MVRWPEIVSEKTGSMVPQNTTTSSAMNTQLFSRKPASRDTIDSSLRGLRSSLRRAKTAAKKVSATTLT